MKDRLTVKQADNALKKLLYKIPDGYDYDKWMKRLEKIFFDLEPKDYYAKTSMKKEVDSVNKYLSALGEGQDVRPYNPSEIMDYVYDEGGTYFDPHRTYGLSDEYEYKEYLKDYEGYSKSEIAEAKRNFSLKEETNIINRIAKKRPNYPRSYIRRVVKKHNSITNARADIDSLIYEDLRNIKGIKSDELTQLNKNSAKELEQSINKEGVSAVARKQTGLSSKEFEKLMKEANGFDTKNESSINDWWEKNVVNNKRISEKQSVKLNDVFTKKLGSTTAPAPPKPAPSAIGATRTEQEIVSAIKNTKSRDEAIKVYKEQIKTNGKGFSQSNYINKSLDDHIKSLGDTSVELGKGIPKSKSATLLDEIKSIDITKPGAREKLSGMYQRELHNQNFEGFQEVMDEHRSKLAELDKFGTTKGGKPGTGTQGLSNLEEATDKVKEKIVNKAKGNLVDEPSGKGVSSGKSIRLDSQKHLPRIEGAAPIGRGMPSSKQTVRTPQDAFDKETLRLFNEAKAKRLPSEEKLRELWESKPVEESKVKGPLQILKEKLQKAKGKVAKTPEAEPLRDPNYSPPVRNKVDESVIDKQSAKKLEELVRRSKFDDEMGEAAKKLKNELTNPTEPISMVDRIKQKVANKTSKYTPHKQYKTPVIRPKPTSPVVEAPGSIPKSDGFDVKIKLTEQEANMRKKLNQIAEQEKAVELIKDKASKLDGLQKASIVSVANELVRIGELQRRQNRADKNRNERQKMAYLSDKSNEIDRKLDKKYGLVGSNAPTISAKREGEVYTKPEQSPDDATEGMRAKVMDEVYHNLPNLDIMRQVSQRAGEIPIPGFKTIKSPEQLQLEKEQEEERKATKRPVITTDDLGRIVSNSLKSSSGLSAPIIEAGVGGVKAVSDYTKALKQHEQQKENSNKTVWTPRDLISQMKENRKTFRSMEPLVRKQSTLKEVFNALTKTKKSKSIFDEVLRGKTSGGGGSGGSGGSGGGTTSNNTILFDDYSLPSGGAPTAPGYGAGFNKVPVVPEPVAPPAPAPVSGNSIAPNPNLPYQTINVGSKKTVTKPQPSSGGKQSNTPQTVNTPQVNTPQKPTIPRVNIPQVPKTGVNYYKGQRVPEYKGGGLNLNFDLGVQRLKENEARMKTEEYFKRDKAQADMEYGRQLKEFNERKKRVEEMRRQFNAYNSNVMAFNLTKPGIGTKREVGDKQVIPVPDVELTPPTPVDYNALRERAMTMAYKEKGLTPNGASSLEKVSRQAEAADALKRYEIDRSEDIATMKGYSQGFKAGGGGKDNDKPTQDQIEKDRMSRPISFADWKGLKMNQEYLKTLPEGKTIFRGVIGGKAVDYKDPDIQSAIAAREWYSGQVEKFKVLYEKVPEDERFEKVIFDAESRKGITKADINKMILRMNDAYNAARKSGDEARMNNAYATAANLVALRATTKK